MTKVCQLCSALYDSVQQLLPVKVDYFKSLSYGSGTILSVSTFKLFFTPEYASHNPATHLTASLPKFCFHSL